MTTRWWVTRVTRVTRWANLTAPVDDDNSHRRVAAEGALGRRTFGDSPGAGLTCDPRDPYRRSVCGYQSKCSTVHARTADRTHAVIRCEWPTLMMESDREQAHLPAEQPPSCKDARLPAAHAHSRRSRHRLGSPAQGSPRAVRLTRPTVAPASCSRPRIDCDARLTSPR